ncbi:putative YL1 nuclear protein [Trypanosoma vivax]|nr:putative YL1 nuclear protein [Trypanosoma vivax]
MDDDSRWDVTEGRRPRRSNRGSMMQELLEKGLNSDEERLLNNLSDVTSDSTFTASQEAVDEVDSDFSDEEIEGVLDGADVETDATLMREEKRERKMERQRTAVRREARFRGERANGLALAPRLRPPPTIPLAVRLAEARKRALEARTGPLGAMLTATQVNLVPLRRGAVFPVAGRSVSMRAWTARGGKR